jgi:hypothetical protein
MIFFRHSLTRQHEQSADAGEKLLLKEGDKEGAICVKSLSADVFFVCAMAPNKYPNGARNEAKKRTPVTLIKR